MSAPSGSIRFVLVAHAPLASALRDVALHVHPECAIDVSAVDVLASWSMEQVLEALANLSRGAEAYPTLYLVDVAGATPANAVMQHLKECTAEAAAVAGVNVPMLWRALAYRHEPLVAVIDRALKGGPMGICVVKTAD